ncbi:MAG TPA: phosphoribosylformylglycinamidine cyclo-ligase [Acidimicrobiia bacterium]|jgi:phosphoribosylformylglycinamidine cyclo-ligase
MTDYGSAGVDLAGAERHVEAIRSLVTATWGPNIVGGFGGFAAGIELPPGMHRPVLMMSTDGVGTKLEIARQLRNWDGVGYDLVAMCVDDLTAVGARPIGFVDYMAVGRLQPDRDTKVVASIASACAAVGAALVGGETAEHPGVMDRDAIDLAGAALGVVEGGEEIVGGSIQVGDLVVGLASRNLRSNGFSLVRRLLQGTDWALGFDGSTIGETVLEPSVLYSKDVLRAMASGAVAGAAHITGGGLPGNLGRPLPEGLTARVDSSTWSRPPIFDHLQRIGDIDDHAMFEAFNMGIGFCLVVRPDRVSEIEEILAVHDPVVIGEIIEGSERVVIG